MQIIRFFRLNLNLKKLNNFHKNAFKQNYKTSSDLRSNDVSTISKKRYNQPPPIDLKKVRTNTGEDAKETVPKPSKYSSIILLGIPIITFGLGVWQIKRREKKLKLIEYLETRTKSEPIDLPTEIKDYDSFVIENEYRPFKVKGHFLHSKEILLTMRHDITAHTHLPGGYVITPFVLNNNSKMTILVNRGFVPYTNFSPTTRQKAQIENEVELVGLLRSSELTSTFTPINNPPSQWHYRDIAQMSKELGTVPIFIDAAKSTTIPGGPFGGQTLIQLRNDHLTYLITWFSLSILTSILWWKRFGKLFF